MKTSFAVLAACVGFALICGCGGPSAQPSGGLVAPATSPAPAAPAPAATTVPADSAVMATVNGQPIYMADLNDILLYSYGLPVAQQLIATELINQEAQRQKVSVTQADVDEEHKISLAQMWPTLPAEQRPAAFQKYLVGSSVTVKQWEMVMRRNAALRKIASSRVTVTRQDLDQAFAEQYGRKVVVRHIQVDTATQAQEVRKELQAGADFIDLVKKQSSGATRGGDGQMMPIGAGTQGLPPAFKDAALALTKVGQLSPVIQTGNAYHILKLEQIIEPQNNKFDEVKDKLSNDIRLVKIQRLQQEILTDLIRDAQDKGKIQYVNPTLKRLEDEARASEERAKP